MSNIIVEIFKENEQIIERIIPANGDRAELKLYSQDAYINLGGKFPVLFSLPVKPDSGYKAGKYNLSLSSLEVGQYSRLMISRDISIIPIS